MQRKSAASWIVIDQPDHAETETRVAPDVAQHGGTRLPGAVEEDSLVPMLRRLDLAAVEREEAALEPQHAEAEEREDRTDQGDESRNDATIAYDADDGDDHEGGGAGEQKPARLLHARVLPHLPVE